MINKIPTHIFLQANPEHVEEDKDFQDLEEVTWTSERVYDNDLVYVRKDIAEHFADDLMKYALSLYDTKAERGEIAKSLTEGCQRFIEDLTYSHS